MQQYWTEKYKKGLLQNLKKGEQQPFSVVWAEKKMYNKSWQEKIMAYFTNGKWCHSMEQYINQAFMI